MSDTTPNPDTGQKSGTLEGRYNHKEAFCLMWYQCKACGGRVRIWNSRDGVTPFGIRCRAGGCVSIDMIHTEFWRDKCVPDHLPAVGDLIFVDMTKDNLKKSVTSQIEAHWDDPTVPMSRMFDDKESALTELVEAQWRDGAPWIARSGDER